MRGLFVHLTRSLDSPDGVRAECFEGDVMGSGYGAICLSRSGGVCGPRESLQMPLLVRLVGVVRLSSPSGD